MKDLLQLDLEAHLEETRTSPGGQRWRARIGRGRMSVTTHRSASSKTMY